MRNIITLLAGIIGTAAMTLFVEAVCVIFKKPFHVVHILSHILRFSSSPKSGPNSYVMYGIALVVHYTIGILFAYGFDFLVKQELIDLTLTDVLLFGSFAGVVGIIGWRICFALHPNPPEVNLAHYLLVIWLGHLVYAVGLFATHTKLQPDPIQAVIPVC
jgi:hypothetical protein